jgi:N utilization substance protein B
MSRRSRAREVVLQVLYGDDLNPQRSQTVVDAFLAARLLEDAGLIQFAAELLAGVRRSRPQLDEILRTRADNWSLERMATTDRNILRLGAYEILHADTPGRVAINEAVELAKRYGARQSAQFVNGVLDRILNEQRTAAGKGKEGED